MATPQYIIDLQLKFIGNKTYLNFWDYVHGNDVIVEVREDKLYQDDKEISLQEFINKVINEVKTY
jgi:hypothetical protein